MSLVTGDTCPEVEVEADTTNNSMLYGPPKVEKWAPPTIKLDTGAEPKNPYLDIVKPVVELMQKKNTDYGSSYDIIRKDFGPESFVVRLADKFHRVKQLTFTKNALVKDESVEDTIRDIIGYCVLELNYRKNLSKPKGAGCNCNGQSLIMKNAVNSSPSSL